MRLIRAVLPVAAALVLAGCGAPQIATRVVPIDALGLSASDIPAVDAEWWRGFGDPQLDRIEADALAGNPTLDQAIARVRQADAMLSRQGAERQPDITADLTPQGQRLPGRYIIPPPFGGSTRFVGTGLANLRWNLDLSGRQRAAIRQAGANAEAARLDAAAARLQIAGAVAQTYVDLARAEAQAAIARRTVAARQGSLRLVEVQVRNQLASRLQVSAARTLLAQANEAAVAAAGNRAVAANALAALAGRGTDYAVAIAPTAARIDTGLAVPRVLPADLLARRPDIAAAQARVAAAAGGREVARRAYYPDLDLTALAGVQAIGVGNLFNADSITAGVGGALHLPIFEGGRLRADLEAATGGLDLAIASYNDRVVGAVRDAADALALIANLDAQRARVREVVGGYAETGRLNAIRVSSGLDSKLDLVDNDIRLLDAELTDANIAADAARQRIALLVALGGGVSPVPEGPAR